MLREVEAGEVAVTGLSRRFILYRVVSIAVLYAFCSSLGYANILAFTADGEKVGYSNVRFINDLLLVKYFLAIARRGSCYVILLLWACAPVQAQEWSELVQNHLSVVLSKPSMPSCNKAPPPFPASQVWVEQQARPLLVDLPTKLTTEYLSKPSVDLLIAFHGRSNSAAQVRQYFGLQGAQHTIVVYPQGVIDSSGRYTWWRVGESPQALRDFALFDAIVARFNADYCINNVYALGYSLGASFVNTLGCARGRVLAGIFTLGGGIENSICQAEVQGGKPGKKPEQGQLAAMILHNPNDRLVPIRYGEAARDKLLRYMQLSSTESHPALPIGWLCQQYGKLPYALKWCPHQQNTTWRGRYYPHNWPRGTGQVALRFFADLSQLSNKNDDL